MKNIKKIILIILVISCKAQTPIVDLADKDCTRINGAYYKDTNNLLNTFQGTYLYTNGTTSFKIVLVKKVQQYNSEYYEDLIIGEYQYIENGVEKVNTLSLINTVYNNQRVHNIDGNSFLYNNSRVWKCPECALGEIGVQCTIRDASSDRFADLNIRKTLVGNQEAIKIKISHVSSIIIISGDPIPPPFSLPIGIYTLIKQ